MSCKLVLTGMLFSALTAGVASAGELSGSIKIDGSSTVFPITEAMAEEFGKTNPKVKVTVGVSGTGGGYKKFVVGETDISDASRPIKDTEIEQAKQKGIDFIEIPVAYDGITIVVNPANKLDSISFDQLKKIWEPGSKVSKWSDVDAKWPNEPIKLYGPGTDSGTFEYFTEDVNGKAKASRADYTASEDDNVLVTGVSGDKAGMGYFGYAYYLENKGKLKALKISKGDKPAVTPEDASIQSGAYPLARPIFITINKKAAERPEVDAFVKFYLTNAKTIVKQVGYSPLPDAMYAEALKKFESRTAGVWKASH